MRTDGGVREVHVGYVSTAEATPDVLSALTSQLPEEEQIRSARYRLPGDQLSFAVGRVLVRKMLSARASTPSGGWYFEQNFNGKPSLLRSTSAPDLHFNLSHCKGLVVAAVMTGGEVGVDAECLQGSIDPLAIAHTCFSPAERSYLEDLPGTRRNEAFFRLWTLKEAYLKAQGTGFAIEPAPCAFSFAPLAVSGSSEGEGQPGEWFFWTDQPSPVHMVAMAAQRRPAERIICSQEHMDLGDLLP